MRLGLIGTGGDTEAMHSILEPVEMVGISMWERVQRCCARGIREGRPLKLAVCPEAWECCLHQLLGLNRPLDIVPSKDGSSARIRVFVCGKPLWLIADESKGRDYDLLTWVDE